MHMSVRFQPDLRAAIRVNLYLARTRTLIGAACGALLILLGATSPGAAWFFYPVGILYLFLVPLVVWVRVYRFRELGRQEAEVTITSEGIERRSEAITLRVAWDQVEQVYGWKREWVFISKRPPIRLVLGKGRLSQEQQAELGSFIKARGLDRREGKMTPAQEAAYSLTYGIARADLKPEVQAEYDRLVAERGPA
jgi:hypothetical protein